MTAYSVTVREIWRCLHPDDRTTFTQAWEDHQSSKRSALEKKIAGIRPWKQSEYDWAYTYLRDHFPVAFLAAQEKRQLALDWLRESEPQAA